MVAADARLPSCYYLEAFKAALQLCDVRSLALQHVSQAPYIGVDRTPRLVNLQAPSTANHIILKLENISTDPFSYSKCTPAPPMQEAARV